MRGWLTWGAVAAAVVFLAVNAGAATAYFYDSARADVIAHGVTVAGVDVGGLTDEQARARLRDVLLPRLQRPFMVTAAGRSFVVDPTRAGLRVEVDRMVAAALVESRRGNLISRFVREVRGARVPATVPLAARYSDSVLGREAAQIAARVERPARSAAVVPGPESLRVVPARWGVSVRRAELAALLRRRVLDPAAPRLVVVPTRSLKPAVTTAGLPRKYAAFITVDREHFRLTFWKNLRRYRTYVIAVGRSGLETPAGLYHINDKQIDPWWHVPNSPWAGDLAGRAIPPGPQDPIKARWMGFWDGAGVHGTDDVASLGSAASHGCIRMAIPDVEQLYDLVPLGTPIYVG